MHQITTQAVAITRPDGSVAIAQIVFEASVKCFSPDAASDSGFALSKDGLFWHRDLTDALIEVDIKKSPRGVASWRRVSDADIPPAEHRVFRDAWTDDGKSIAIAMPKARVIHRDRIRADRVPLFSRLDADYVRADETGDAKAKRAIIMRKQALRDAPAHASIEAARSPEELAGLTLDVLTKEGLE